MQYCISSLPDPVTVIVVFLIRLNTCCLSGISQHYSPASVIKGFNLENDFIIKSGGKDNVLVTVWDILLISNRDIN